MVLPLLVNFSEEQLGYVLRKFLDNLVEEEKIANTRRLVLHHPGEEVVMKHGDCDYSNTFSKEQAVKPIEEKFISNPKTSSALLNKRIKNISYPVVKDSTIDDLPITVRSMWKGKRRPRKPKQIRENPKQMFKRVTKQLRDKSGRFKSNKRRRRST